MKKIKLLALGLDAASSRELRARQTVALVQNQIDSRQQTLEQLDRYGKEYRATLIPGAGTPVSARMMKQTQAFLGSLEIAMTQQVEEIERLREASQHHRECWDRERRHKAVLEKMIQRLELETRRGEEQAEQRALDDRTQVRSDPYSVEG